jgi:hypothetical protein
MTGSVVVVNLQEHEAYKHQVLCRVCKCLKTHGRTGTQA